MALRYNDRTGEFEEVGGSTRRRPHRSPAPRRSSGGGWDSDTTVGCIVLVLIAAGAFWILRTVVPALLGSKWFWIVLVCAFIGYICKKD